MYDRSRVKRKSAFCICENKDADQLRGNREADQRICFRYTDLTISLLPKSVISSILPSSLAVQPGLCGTGRKSRRPVFSQRGLYDSEIYKSYEGCSYDSFSPYICLFKFVLIKTLLLHGTKLNVSDGQ